MIFCDFEMSDAFPYQTYENKLKMDISTPILNMLMNSRRSAYSRIHDEEQNLSESVELDERDNDNDNDNYDDDDDDDDDENGPPPSILVEGDNNNINNNSNTRNKNTPTRLKYSQDNTHQSPIQTNDDYPQHSNTKAREMNSYQLAMWKWVNVQNLDKFLQEVSETAMVYKLK